MFSVLWNNTQEKELLCFHREAFNTYTVNRNICRSTNKGETVSVDKHNWSLQIDCGEFM